jgi:rhodanese-related sulfurtransferase
MMLSFIKKLFSSDKTDYRQMIKEGAIILDVRTKGEYDRGHIEGAINIPVYQLNDNVQLLKDKEKPIITCCASGIRSAAAINILKSNGFTRLINGGGWQSLNKKIN